MSGDHTVMVEILDAIEHGNLSVHETRRRLERIIDAEIEKTDAPANMELVEACEKLLWELNTNGQVPYVSHMEENKAAVIKRLSEKERPMFGLRNTALRVCAAVAALFLLFIGADALLHREWLDRGSTDDEQQQVITGEVVDPGLVQGGVAGESTQSRSQMITKSMEEASTFLGIGFSIPERPQGDWQLSHIECTKAKRQIKQISYFTHPSDPQRRLTIYGYQFSNVEDAYLTYEQNKEGSTVNIKGIDLYLSTNNKRTQCMWMIDTRVYSIDGHIDYAEALKIAEQIIGES